MADGDRINLAGRYTAISTIVGGVLSAASFEDDLAAAIEGAMTGMGTGALFTAGAGTLAGATFLVLESNGVAGYQAGQDIVIRADGLAGVTGGEALAMLV